MPRNIKYILLLILVVCCFISSSYSQGIKASFSPSARFFPGFGSVTISKSKDQTITIRNDSSSTGALSCSVSAPTGPNYSVVGATNFSVDIGQTYVLTLRFQPQSAGLLRDTIFITHNADTTTSLKNPVRYVLSGTGVAPDTFPKITVNTGSGAFGNFLNLGTVTVGKTSTATFTVKNTSDTIRTLSGIVGMPSSSRFSITSGGGAFSLDTGKFVTVTVSFTPDTVAQFLQDSIIITSNANSANNRIKVTLFGSGKKADPFPQILISGLQMGGINFRNDTLPKTKSVTFSIRNTSDSLRTLAGSISSPGSPFTITSGGGAFSLDSGMKLSVTVTFSPTSVGIFKDTISITSNTDPANQLINIPLQGAGVIISGPRISVKPGALIFGSNIFHGGLVSLTATIKNLADSAQDTLSGTVSTPGLPFMITSGGGNFSLAHNDSMHVIVQMTTDSIGAFNDSLVITSNSNDNSKRVVVRLSGNVTFVGAVKDGKSSGTNLIAATPNPFTGKTSITFMLATASPINLKVYNMLGKEVFTSSENIYPAGIQKIEWDASEVESGAYLFVLRIGNEIRSVRAVRNR